MRDFHRWLSTAVILLWSVVSAYMQTAADPSGHWEGTIQYQDVVLNVEIDLAKNGKGELAGTFSQPAQNIKGLPLSTVTSEGRNVRILLKGGEEQSTFVGTLSPDGKMLTGDVTQGSYTAAFAFTRTGDARIAPAPRNAPIGKELEGTWNGTLELAGRQMRIVLTMANQPDGTATGSVASPDGSGVEIPIAIAQTSAGMKIDVASVGASYTGVLNASGTEIVGTWMQQGTSLPLTFRRAKP